MSLKLSSGKIERQNDAKKKKSIRYESGDQVLLLSMSSNEIYTVIDFIDNNLQLKAPNGRIIERPKGDVIPTSKTQKDLEYRESNNIQYKARKRILCTGCIIKIPQVSQAMRFLVTSYNKETQMIKLANGLKNEPPNILQLIDKAYYLLENGIIGADDLKIIANKSEIKGDIHPRYGNSMKLLADLKTVEKW